MDRREAVRQITTLLGVGLTAPTLAGLMGGCTPRPAGGYMPQTLTRDQYRLVVQLTEHLIPQTNTPGAQAAGVPAFIDEMLTHWHPASYRQRFLAGLEAVDTHAEETYGNAYLSCTIDQQLALLDQLDREAFPEAGTPPPAEGPPAFLRLLKELTVTGYYTSEAGATQELRVNPMGVYRGDIPYAEIGHTWA